MAQEINDVEECEEREELSAEILARQAGSLIQNMQKFFKINSFDLEKLKPIKGVIYELQSTFLKLKEQGNYHIASIESSNKSLKEIENLKSPT